MNVDCEVAAVIETYVERYARAVRIAVGSVWDEDRAAASYDDLFPNAEPHIRRLVLLEAGRAMKRCKHPGCRLAGINSCECFGANVVRPPVYVVWHTPTHPEKPWAVGCEIRPGCLKIAGYVESKRLADLLAQRLSDGDY